MSSEATLPLAQGSCFSGGVGGGFILCGTAGGQLRHLPYMCAQHVAALPLNDAEAVPAPETVQRVVIAVTPLLPQNASSTVSPATPTILTTKPPAVSAIDATRAAAVGTHFPTSPRNLPERSVPGKDR